MKNYLKISNWFLYDNKLTPTDKLLFALILHNSEVTGFCTKTDNDYALILNVTDRTIRTSIQKLKRLDYINTNISGAKTGIMRVITPKPVILEIACIEDTPTKIYSLKIPNWLLYDNKLTPTEKMLFALILHNSEMTGFCTKTNHDFAFILNVTDRTIQTLIQKLNELGYIDTTKIGAETGIIRVIAPKPVILEKMEDLWDKKIN